MYILLDSNTLTKLDGEWTYAADYLSVLPVASISRVPSQDGTKISEFGCVLGSSTQIWTGWRPWLEDGCSLRKGN